MRAGHGIDLQIPSSSQDVIRAATLVAQDVRISESQLLVQFGVPRNVVVEVGSRCANVDIETVSLTIAELHVIYLLLVAVPNWFASEESFHIRTGFFKENFVDIGRGLLKASEGIFVEEAGGGRI